MSETAANSGATQRRDMVLLASLSLLLSVATCWIALGIEGLGALGAYFDGHFYIEIARSFPLPYSPDGRDYLGHAPGFAALLSVARLLTPDLLHWGWLSLVATWLSAVTAVLAFYLLCLEVEVPALPASLTFAFLSPAWVLVSSAAHAEPLAMTFALLCFVAHSRGSLPWSVFWLSLALLTRFPALLLGGALAFDLLVIRRQLAVRTFAWLAVPLAVFGLHNLYLHWRVPGFVGIWEAHQLYWVTSWTYPFDAMIDQWERMSTRRLFQREIIYGTAAFYTAVTLVGFRPSERRYWWLALWLAPILLLHVSLTGKEGVESFTRLALLAWPAAVLIAWRWLPRPVPLAAVVVACVAVASFGVWSSHQKIRAAVFMQNRSLWMELLVGRLSNDHPSWIDFKQNRDLEKAWTRRVELRREREARREQEENRKLERPDEGG